MKHATILLCIVLPLHGQGRGGPAILSRGEAPSAMISGGFSFQPFVNAQATYNTGLRGVGLPNEGDSPNRNAAGTTVGWGVSGRHGWRFTELGLSYVGNASHYFSQSRYDSFSQALSLGLRRQLSRRINLTFTQSAGFFTRLTGLEGLRQTVPFDPATTYLPTTEFFDNRTYYLSSQAGLMFQKSTRLSFSFSGGGFLMKHQSKALYGTRGMTAYGDMQYRLSRRITVGGLYQFSTFRFTGIYGDSYIQASGGSMAYQFSRNVEMSGFVGAMRTESKFVQKVAIDPAIAALLGITAGSQVVHTTSIRPYWSVRLSRTFKDGVLYGSAGQTTVPGNGLFLTSYTTRALAGYGYTGLRRWSFNLTVSRAQSKSVGNIAGPYNTLVGGVSMSRQITSSLHFVAHYWVRRYDSSAYSNYNRMSQTAAVGFGFSPGNVPLRLW